MAKLSQTDIASIATAVTSLNANYDALITALENTLSRDGTAPNAMGANLDMNSNRILNLPEGTSNLEPVRRVDLDTLINDASVAVKATAAEAAALTLNTVFLTPLTVKNSIEAYVGVGLGELIVIGNGAPLLDRDTQSVSDLARTIVIGTDAMEIATKSRNNVVIGYEAMKEADPGEHNICIGTRTGYYLDGTANRDGNGARNIFIGGLAGHFATTAVRCIAIGRDSQHSLTTGNNNTAVGYRALTGGFNPKGFGGDVITLDTITAGGQTAVGYEALRRSNGDQNTGFGQSVLEEIKSGNDNTGVGAFALNKLDEDLSPDGFTFDTNGGSGWAGTYSVAGTTITVTATGINAVVGKRVMIDFGAVSTGTDLSDYTIEYEVVTAPDANTFTVTADASVTSTGALVVTRQETATSRTASTRNTAIGRAAGGGLTSADRCVFIGYFAGNNSVTSLTTMSNALVIGTRTGVYPLVGGDFENGYFGINVLKDDLSKPFQVHAQAALPGSVGSQLFAVGSTGNLTTGGSRIMIGGETSSQPALISSGTELQVRLADNSNYAGLQALSLQLRATAKITAAAASANIILSNVAVTDFGLLQFGGTTSSFPSLKRSSTVLQARLADDSGFAPLQGQIRSHANATAETPAATHTLRFFDAAGTEYKVLAAAA